MDGDWGYEALDVPPEELERKLRAMAGEGFAGANVTVPHKESALAIADTPSEMAREIGAANTLVFAARGNPGPQHRRRRLSGGAAGIPGGERALVLGAGGAARAVVWALEREGAAVEVWNRSPERAAAICAELGGAPVAEPDQGGYELIVNTSAAGLGGEDPFAHLPLDAGRFASAQTVVDMVYGDSPSPLLVAAEAAGARVVDGIEVLVQQGALSLRVWTGREPPLETMRAAARA